MMDERLPAAPQRAAEWASLAQELGRLARTSPDELTSRLRAMAPGDLAELALRLPAGERLEVVLHAPKPMELVRALPDAELYLTVRELGPHDALPLLPLASTAQLQHLIDLESWRRDRFDAERCGAWVAVLAESGQATLRRFLRSADDELLALLLQRWLRVEQIELDDTPSVHGTGRGEAGDERGLVSPDGHHRVSPERPEHAPAARQLLQILFLEQRSRYEHILWLALWNLPAELEESALRWRQSRLEERGFPPWDEALAAYAPPTGVRAKPEPLEPDRPDAPKAPRSPIRVLSGRGILIPALERLGPHTRETALHELVSLANRLLVADARDVGDPEVHRGALEKAAGYIGIALERRGAEAEGQAARVLGEVPALELFREGNAHVVRVQERARRLVREGWPRAHPRALGLLDPPLGERLAGVLRPRPLYLDLARGEGEEALREFRSLAEVEETRAAVEMAEVVGGVLVEQLGLDVARLVQPRGARPGLPRFSTVLLTTLAWHSTRRELRCDVLPAEVAADFLRTVASRRTAAPEAPGRSLEAVVAALGAKLGLGPRELAVLRGFGRACLETLAAECGGLDPGTPVDPRHVSCLLPAE
jgi:hypothetical protein